MQQLTKEQANILTGYTGILFGAFGDYLEDVEKRLGRPVWTHQLPALEKEITEAYREDFFAILPDGVNKR